MFCPKCGTALPENTKFCFNCGYGVQAPRDAAPNGGVIRNDPINISTPPPPEDPPQKRRGYLKTILITIAVFFLILAGIGACSSMNGGGDGSSPSSVKQEPSSSTHASVSIDEAVIFDDHGILIQVNGGEINETYTAYEIPFYFENSNSYEVSVDVHACAVNGIMYENGRHAMDTGISSGKKSANTLSISKEWMDSHGFETIEYLELNFWEYSDFTKDFETGVIEIQTSAYDGRNAFPGDCVYSDSTIELRNLGIHDQEIMFSVVNVSSFYIDIDIEDVSVNDWSYRDAWRDIYDNQEIFPDCIAFYTVGVKEEFLRSNAISEITQFEFSLLVSPLGEYESEYTTQPVILD